MIPMMQSNRISFLDFFKIGGFCILMPCLDSKYSDVRSETAMLVGELAQNNPFCQQKLLEMDILPKLIERLTDEPEVAAHSFHAISCMVRSYEPAQAVFIDIGGLECMLGLIQAKDQEKLIIKSMFLMSAFSQDFPAVRDELVKLNAIERVIKTIEPKDEYDTRLELTLSALIDLIETDGGIERCRKESLNLKPILEQVIALGKGRDECQVSHRIQIYLISQCQHNEPRNVSQLTNCMTARCSNWCRKHKFSMFMSISCCCLHVVCLFTKFSILFFFFRNNASSAKLC